jgi:hypothetical protein
MSGGHERGGSTRRQAIAAAAAIGVAAQPALAFAAADDSKPLEALVAYQQDVVAHYEAALEGAPLTGDDRATLQPCRADARHALAALQKALADAGGEPAAIPPASPPADASRRGWIRALIAAESGALAAYYDSLQTLTDERHLKGSAAFMAQSGRHVVVLRKLAGDPLLPRAFETGNA